MFLTLALVSGAVGALAEDHNELGIFLDPADLTSVTLDAGGLTFFNPYLVLLNPYSEENGEPFDFINVVNARMELPAGDFLLDVDSDFNFWLWSGWPELVIIFEDPVPVVDGQVVVGRLTILTMGAEGSYYYLVPSEAFGNMSFVACDEYESFLGEIPLFPVSGSCDAPVFAVNGSVVPAETQTWGGVKALYR